MVVKDDVQVYDSLFAFMAKLHDDKYDKVTLLVIKENLKTFFFWGTKVSYYSAYIYY